MSKHFELAGFTDNDGDLGRRVPSGQIWIPKEVWLADDDIHWRGDTGHFSPVSTSMLNQFVRLGDASSVLRFAKKWGVLALFGAEKLSWTGETLLRPGHANLEAGSEPIAGWLYYARRASAVLNIAAALKQGKLGDLADWDKIGGRIDVGKTEEKQIMSSFEANIGRPTFGMPIVITLLYPNTKIQDARNLVSSEIANWLDCWKIGKTRRLSDFSLRWSIDENRWKLEYDYQGFLFPAIALQIALVVADADSLFSCSGCGHPYIRPRSKKRPKHGWANYCEVCAKEGIAERRATESYRAKRAQAARLHAAGATVSQIAEQLRTDGERVSGWIQGRDKREKT